MTGWQRPPAWTAELIGRFPGWECWKGTSGLLYARRCGTSGPPVRGEDPAGLADSIIAAERSDSFVKHSAKRSTDPVTADRVASPPPVTAKHETTPS